MLKSKKGQTAVEYIHTYGWVLITVVVLGGALAYYNMGDIKNIVPRDCSFLSGFDCLDVLVDDGLLVVGLRNTLDFGMNNLTLTVNGTCNTVANTSVGNFYSNPAVLMPHKQYNFVFECQNLSGVDVEEKILVNYKSVTTGIEHKKVGRLYYEGNT